MDLPVCTWKAHCAICKTEGIDPLSEERIKGQFETWMRERAALNMAIETLDCLTHSAKISTGEIIAFLNQSGEYGY